MTHTKTIQVKTKAPSRRLRIWYVSPQCLVAYLQRYDNWPDTICAAMIKGPPDESIVRAVHYEQLRECLAVTVEHESFDEVAPGEEIPTVKLANLEKYVLQKDVDGAYRVSLHIKDQKVQTRTPYLDAFERMTDQSLLECQQRINEVWARRKKERRE